MNRIRIEQLVKLLPGNCNLFRHGSGEFYMNRPAQRLAAVVNKPDFPLTFVKEFASRGEALPPTVTEAYLREAHAHWGEPGPVKNLVMQRVEELLQPANQYHQSILNALLIVQDTTFEQIAEWLSLPVAVVKIYEQLCFNVRDRRQEQSYIAGIVFPGGRAKWMNVEVIDEDLKLLQAGWIHGASEVLWLAGLDREESQAPSAAQHQRELTNRLMTNAVEMARSGSLNLNTASGLGVMKTLLAAKPEAPSGMASDSEAGIGALNWGPGDAIMYTVRGLQPQPDEPGYVKPDYYDVSLQKALDENKKNRELERQAGKT
jgi:hypothetical protein